MIPGDGASSNGAEEPKVEPQTIGDTPMRLPEIRVRTEAAHVAAFQQQTGELPVAGRVPLTFPFCWLTLPAVRPMLTQMIGGAAFVPIHEAQSFDYERPLATDADYQLAFEFQRKADPARVIVNATISTLERELCARFETVLRIVPVAAVAGP
jgi:hypothetical protein